MSAQVTEADIAILEQQPDETLADWWCELNKWGWPAQIPDPQTELGRSRDMSNNRGSAIMGWIDVKVGSALISYHWNKDRMTKEEWQQWWSNPRGYKFGG